ncbi:MAG TPA: LiaF domain-containing protein [Oscillospiraceae bacterium]|nr:LiaF domain-containing protein [Oscillospiraceae bacterium]
MQFDKSKSLLGIVVITAGIILLLDNLNIIAGINLFAYWPVLLIVWGLQSLWTGSKNPAAQGISAFVIILGFIFLANSLTWAEINVGRVFQFFFPVLIILIGGSIFLGRSFAGKANLAIMGAVERGKTSSWQLESGSYVAFLGGIDLDLRHAIIPEGETVLDLTAVMGGIDIRVPADIPVVADGFAVLGGVEFFGKGSGGIVGSTHTEQNIGEGNQVLIIQARAVMGGIDIKRV